MLRRNNRVNLLPQQLKKTGHIKLMSRRFIRSEIFFGEPKEPHRWIHPRPSFGWVGRWYCFCRCTKPPAAWINPLK